MLQFSLLLIVLAGALTTWLMRSVIESHIKNDIDKSNLMYRRMRSNRR